MNENDNKMNKEPEFDGKNDNETGAAPENECTKAFNWDYSPDGDLSSERFDQDGDASEQSPVEEPRKSETDKESTDIDQAGAEQASFDEQSVNDDNETTQDQSDVDGGDNEQADEESSFDPIFDDETAQRPRARHSGKNTPLILSIALSGCAVILLISLALLGALGLFPTQKAIDREVVYIGVSSPDSSEPPESATSSDMLEDFINSVVIIKAETAGGTSVGTGIILTENGYIVTNHHVIENATDIYVWLYGNDTPEKASLIGHKEMDDIAVIKIDKTGLRRATFAKSDECRLGERVYAIGTPEGDEFGWSITSGIISCSDREIKLYNNDGTLQKKMHVVQTDASVNPGNSGGPLINSRGEVVGIITLKLSNSAGMGFAIPSDGALIDIEAIIEHGHANDVDAGISIGRPLIGITGVGVKESTWYESYELGGVMSIREVTEDYATKHPSTTFYSAVAGVYVSATSDGLDAKNKLQKGDIITKVNNIEVSNIYAVMNIINEFNGGEEVSVTFHRNGEYFTVTIILGTEKQ
ncbi:MAG: trypsin-like serine protease [Ruminococcaceae bacterium]|nr:trypsin-like serine protease [Oscillospiraceae bacterium]